MSLIGAAVLAVLVTTVGIAGSANSDDQDAVTVGGPPIVSVRVPEALSAQAQLGRETYEANCASCHGRNAAGQHGIAPPLIHVIYEPGHHDDESFLRAVARGTRSHHWPFGDMPPVAGLSRRDVVPIIAYIRELQRFNNIR